MQEATDLALQAGARDMEVGAALNSTGETNFIQTFVCNTTAGRLLECGNLHIKVQVLPAGYDFSTISNGTLPVSGNVLNLQGYDGTNGVSVFCTAPPGSLILISAVYVGPTFLSGLLPFVFNETYNGYPVHAVLSQVGVASEQFQVPATQPKGTAPQC